MPQPLLSIMMMAVPVWRRVTCKRHLNIKSVYRNERYMNYSKSYSVYRMWERLFNRPYVKDHQATRAHSVQRHNKVTLSLAVWPNTNVVGPSCLYSGLSLCSMSSVLWTKIPDTEHTIKSPYKWKCTY